MTNQAGVDALKSLGLEGVHNQPSMLGLVSGWMALEKLGLGRAWPAVMGWANRSPWKGQGLWSREKVGRTQPAALCIC